MSDSSEKSSRLPNTMTVVFTFLTIGLVFVAYFGTIMLSMGGGGFSFLIVLPLLIVTIPVVSSGYIYRKANPEQTHSDRSYLGSQILTILSGVLIVGSVLVLNSVFIETFKSSPDVPTSYGSSTVILFERLLVGTGFACGYWIGFLYDGRKKSAVIAGVFGACIGIVIKLVLL